VLLREKLPFGNRTFNGGSFFPFPARNGIYGDSNESLLLR